MEKPPFPFHFRASLHSINLGIKVIARLFNWLCVFIRGSFQTDNVFGSSKSLRPHTNYSFSLPSRVLGRSILVARLARHTNQPWRVQKAWRFVPVRLKLLPGQPAQRQSIIRAQEKDEVEREREKEKVKMGGNLSLRSRESLVKLSGKERKRESEHNQTVTDSLRFQPSCHLPIIPCGGFVCWALSAVGIPASYSRKKTWLH